MSDEGNYGVDAPGVMAGLTGGALAGLTAGLGLRTVSKSAGMRALGAVVAVGALAPLGLGVAMGAYALAGKRRFRDWLLDLHQWRGDEVVLDIGAGRGLLAVAAAKRVPRGRVIAIDIWRNEDLSGNGPDGLIANAEREGVTDRIEVRTADATSLDLPDASVDLVVSALCIHNIEDSSARNSALRHIARVLKPGGRALIADYTGVGGYVDTLRQAGLEAGKPLNAMAVAYSLMFVADARKPL